METKVINLCDMVNHHIKKRDEVYDPEYFIRAVKEWQQRPEYRAYFAKKAEEQRRKREAAKRKAERENLIRKVGAVVGGVFLSAGTALLVVFGIF